MYMYLRIYGGLFSLTGKCFPPRSEKLIQGYVYKKLFSGNFNISCYSDTTNHSSVHIKIKITVRCFGKDLNCHNLFVILQYLNIKIKVYC